MPNIRDFFPATQVNDYYGQYDHNTSFTSFFWVGYVNSGFGSPDTVSGAVRFAGVNISQNTVVTSAHIHVYAQFRTGSDPIKIKIEGIKENDTADFSSSPGGRPRTTANVTTQITATSQDVFYDFDVTNIVNEIFAQGGWAGNHLGFWFSDNGTTHADDRISWNAGSVDWVLSIQQSATPNLFPSPKTDTAGSVPASTDYGIKIALPGYDVLNATDDQLLYTTRKDILRVVSQGSVNCTANVEQLITHNLGYVPMAIAFAQGGGKSFQLPRFFASASDPIGGGLEGYIEVDSTYLRITTFQDSAVYYYIFLDKVPQ